MTLFDFRRRIAVVGAGAAGTLTAARLLERAGHRGVALDVVLVDSGEDVGRGPAYSTPNPRHLLNVPTAAISADPDEPGDFAHWLAARGEWDDPYSFQPRARYGCYLADLLEEAVKAGPATRLRRVCDRAVGIAERGPRDLTLTMASGDTVAADAIVLALGQFAPDVSWAPVQLRESPCFVADPWAPGALAGVPDARDVLLVGTGLTMVDVAVALCRPGRVVHAVSRRGLLPQVHSSRPLPRVDPPRLEHCADLDDLRRAVRQHISAHRRRGGDWRPAFDSLRSVTAQAWRLLSTADRERFLAEDARLWDTHRHRIAPATGAILQNLRAARRLDVGAATVVGCAPSRRDHDGDDRDDGGAVLVRLSDGRELRVGAVVNCTGPTGDFRRTDDPLVSSLLANGHARPGPVGLGLDTEDDGRLLDAQGRSDRPLWTLGAARRGSLWESTAIPEIRLQALDLAAILLDGTRSGRPGPAAPRSRRPQAPTDRYNLRLSTTEQAAAAFNAGMECVLRLAEGAEDHLAEAVALDPGFALGHAALALLGIEWGIPMDVPAVLAMARLTARARANERERSFVEVVLARAADSGAGPDRPWARALLRHIDDHPRDALAVSIAVPTVAFGGIAFGRSAWDLVDRLGHVYGRDDWWYDGELAFVRQEQGRWREAEELAARALARQPDAGHAAHARAHVFYETGDHGAGLAWLDGWLARHGPRANSRAHFSWHAALHELALGDSAAVRQRYEWQLAPPLVTGARAMVDSASLLWRCLVLSQWSGRLPAAELAEAGLREWVRTPPTPFAALHGALTLAAAGDAAGLDALRRWAAGHTEPVHRTVVAPLCAGLAAVVEQRWEDGVTHLGAVLPRVGSLQGSVAQLEVVEETLLYAMVSAGRSADAARLLQHRLDRRPRPADSRRLARLR